MVARFKAAIDDLEQLIEHHLGLIDTLPADCYVVEVTGGRSVRVYDDGDIGLGNYRYPQHFALEDCEQLKEVLAGYELKITLAKDWYLNEMEFIKETILMYKSFLED